MTVAQGLAAFHAALRAQLAQDAALADWAQTHFGRAFAQLDGNRELQRVRPQELPAQIFELGAGESEPLAMAGRQRTAASIGVAIAWRTQDPAAAFAQRVVLPELVTRAVMQAPRLGGAVEAAWVSGFEPLQAAFSGEVHVLRCTVTCEYMVQR